MKKLTLTTLTAAVALVPMLAHAANEQDRSADRSAARVETYRTIDLNGNTVVRGEERISSGGSDFMVDIDRTESAYVTRSGMPAYTFLTPEGERILVEGEAVYMVSESGGKFFAPNATYTAPNGLTFVAENGILLRTEVPDQTAYVFTDADQGDVDVKMVTPRRAY